MSILERLNRLVADRRFSIGLFVFLALSAAVQSLLLPLKTFSGGTMEYTEYNNYIIFRQAFAHLRDGLDLYSYYPAEHWDLFKYTPSFAAFFGVFALFPDAVGMPLWNLLNALALCLGIWYLPRLSPWAKGMACLLVAVEAMTALQNEQSNALIAGCLILALGLLERRRDFLAALCIAGAAFIKIYGIFGFVLFLFYRRKIALSAWGVLAMAIMAALPLLLVDLEQYRFLLASYQRLLGEDHSISYGLSALGLMKVWLGLEPNKVAVVLVGFALFLMPLTRWRLYRHFGFRYLTLASALLWLVVFNHKVESPTFVLAMAGAGLWFVVEPRNRVNIGLILFALLLTSLSTTDLFPRPIREAYIKPYLLKGVPVVLIWCKVLWDMFRYPAEGHAHLDGPKTAKAVPTQNAPAP